MGPASDSLLIRIPLRENLARLKDGMHIYATNAALSIEAQITRGGFHTLGIEAARKINGAYHWDDKIRIQVTPMELPVVISVIMGWIPLCQFKHHGEDKNKGFEIKHQRTNLYVALEEKDRGGIGVPVSPSDAFGLAALATRQLCANHPEIDARLVLELCKSTTARMIHAKQG